MRDFGGANVRASAQIFAAAMLLAAGCGRAQLEALGGGSLGDGSLLGNDGAPSGGDGTIPEGDGAISMGDGSVGRPDGFVRDGSINPGPDGSTGECASVPDCFRVHGRPPRCEAGPASWACQNGQCIGECGPTMCTNDCDCSPFDACLGGTCMPANRNNQCCTNPICPPGQMCELPGGGSDVCPMRMRPDAGIPDAGGFFPDAGSTTGTPVGAMCTTGGTECGTDGFCIDQTNFPDGYCSQDCGPGSGPCPGDAVCRNVMRGRICLDGCMSNTDCRTGYHCVQLGFGSDRVCWPIPPSSMNPMGAPVGSDCGMDDDCASGLQCFNFPRAPGGYCTLEDCDQVTNPCPTGSQCYALVGLLSMCLEECPNAGTQSTCRMGYRCFGPMGGSGVCLGM